MSGTPPADKISALIEQPNIWFVSVRPEGRPHMTPVWFVYQADKIFIGIDPNSIKSRNIQLNPNVVLALEDGSHPLICEGTARLMSPPITESLAAAFLNKYDWDMAAETQFHQIVEITPRKWLSW